MFDDASCFYADHAWNTVCSKAASLYSSCAIAAGEDFPPLLLPSYSLTDYLLICAICFSAVTAVNIFCSNAKSAGTFAELVDVGRGDSFRPPASRFPILRIQRIVDQEMTWNQWIQVVWFE